MPGANGLRRPQSQAEVDRELVEARKAYLQEQVKLAPAKALAEWAKAQMAPPADKAAEEVK